MNALLNAEPALFQRAPTLGGECYYSTGPEFFQALEFQWAPTLGGECYILGVFRVLGLHQMFQWAPTLGGECYTAILSWEIAQKESFNGHPPLGVNATHNKSG